MDYLYHPTPCFGSHLDGRFHPFAMEFGSIRQVGQPECPGGPRQSDTGVPPGSMERG
jgi:hypothetical protein